MRQAEKPNAEASRKISDRRSFVTGMTISLFGIEFFENEIADLVMIEARRVHGKVRDLFVKR